MASLGEVRDAVKQTLEAAIGGLHAYDTVPSSPLLPAVVVVPRAAAYGASMGRGVDDTFELELAVLCSTADDALGQDTLDALLSGYGSRSIRQAVFLSGSTTRHSSLGLPLCRAKVTRMDSYGTSFEAASVEHVGAVLRLEVVTAAAA